MHDRWYKEAVVYSLDVETYQDSNADGVGDFKGLTQRLDYLSGLGVTCIWLLPFFPSPNRDNRYDIVDYYGVAEPLGSLGDFVEFMHGCHERGIRVLIDLVVNHTSDQHPWFQEARDPSSDKHDWYVWRDEKPEEPERPVLYEEGDDSVWAYDEKADKYYLRQFYKHQPDLNIANPKVREEIREIMAFWLELGVSGFRLDAARHVIGIKGIEDEMTVDSPFEYLKQFRDFIQWRKGDAILLAEANVPAEKMNDYFENGAQMLFNFALNQHLFLALARQEAAPLKEGLKKPGPPPNDGQWANFLRNHDELVLDGIDEKERHEIFGAFAPEEEMQFFDRGIRRRLAPMFEGNEQRLRMAYSLMFSLPGTPVLRYGQEIGMGDDLSLIERQSIRTPMQWSSERNAGFSKAPADELTLPVIDEGPYSYHNVNVQAQRRDPDSRLNWMERMIRWRTEHRETGYGDWTILETEHPSVFAHACTWKANTLVTIHNLGDTACTVQLDMSDLSSGHIADLHGDREYEPLEGNPPPIDLEPYGYRWLHIDH